MSWLMGFYNEDEGPIYDINSVYKLYQLQGIVGSTVAFLCVGFIGKISDKVSIKITLPISLLFRALIFFLMTRVEHPSKDALYFVAMPFYMLSYYAVVIVQSSYI